MDDELISQREFARRLNVGEKTIRDGVKLGKISKGIIIENGKPKINYPIAFREAQAVLLGHNALINKILSKTGGTLHEIVEARGKIEVVLNGFRKRNNIYCGKIQGTTPRNPITGINTKIK